ncbi:MAG TPA: glucose-6-phosphate dehydrogenase [Candidatus Babeliales bacterium]|nr:glucose-6-phosphate dehydrogenase [Candidatus Babeliales bacterium]
MKNENQDCTFIILGATGDLAKRKLIPAIYALVQEKKISNFAIIGAADSTASIGYKMMEQAREYITEFDQKIWDACCQSAAYCQLNFNNEKDFAQLHDIIIATEKKFNLSHNRLIYCSTAPHFFAPITKALAKHNIIIKGELGNNNKPWHRVIYEKPFGTDFVSAKKINQIISEYLEEEQIFRIDHYLAKEIVATIAMIRFTNRVLEPLWSHHHIENIQIVLSETMGMVGRGIYYDKYGALKDVVQNHILQILALVTMETPEKLSGNFIRDKKAEILKHTTAIGGLLGQYEGYKQESGVDQNSTTETFAALEFRIDNDRWRHTPFFVRTGKQLQKKETVIYIRFKPVECLMTTFCPSEPNFLIIRIAPEEGFSLELNAKRPGVFDEIIPVAMDYCHDCTFAPRTPQGYELLLQEVLKGEQSVSVRFDEIEYSWKIIDSIQKLNLPCYTYAKDSIGPKELYDFQIKHNMRWRA